MARSLGASAALVEGIERSVARNACLRHVFSCFEWKLAGMCDEFPLARR